LEGILGSPAAYPLRTTSNWKEQKLQPTHFHSEKQVVLGPKAVHCCGYKRYEIFPMMPSRSVATTSFLALLLSPLATVSANSFNRYAGYMPTTKVTDEAALDLDQHDFNLELSERRIKEGLVMYTQGGHSGSYAILSISNAPAGSEDTYLKGTEVIGRSSFDEVVRGTLRKDVTLDSQDEVNLIEVLYDVNGTQSNYVGCQVGGLSTLERANRDGCTWACNVCQVVMCAPPNATRNAFSVSHDFHLPSF
jgi:hypothetical protein